MTKMHPIREATPSDIPALKTIIASTDLFPADMLDDMIAPFFSGAGADEIWLIVEHDSAPVGLAYCAAERMTEGTKNLLLIAVHPQRQGAGFGAALLAALEARLAEASDRVLLVETSGLPDYEATRHFYHKNGYHEEARIRDFYKDGEDKIVFWKRLKP